MLALAGCTPPEPKGPVAPPSPEASASLTAEQQEAKAAVEEFFRTYDETLADPEKSVDDVKALTAGAMTKKIELLVKGFREQGVLQGGEVDYELIAYRDTFQKGDEEQLGFEVCANMTDITAIDVETGKPAKEAAPLVEYQVWRLLAVDKDGWKIVDAINEEATSCS